jgi:flagellar hook protein FlgE
LDSTNNPFLPIGYADIAYNDKIGDAKIKIDGIEYNTSFATNVLSTDGTGYLTITLDSGNGTPAGKIVFDMTGIKDGKPVLEFPVRTTPPPPTRPTEVPVDLNGTTPAATADVTYNGETGLLKVTNPADGSTFWEINLFENMSYNSFTVTDLSGTAPVDYNFIAEFNERTGGSLGSSPTTLTLWYPETTTTGTPPVTTSTIKKLTATVSFKTDGTFDNVVWDPPTGQDFPGTNYNSTNFKIAVSETNASILEVQVSKDLKTTNPTVFDTVSQIAQGGVEQTKVTVFDCQGNPYTMEITFKKMTQDHWRWEAFFPDNPELFDSPPSGELKFGTCGKLVEPLDGVDIYVPFSLLGTKNEIIHLDFSNKYFKGDDYVWDTDALEGLTQYASSTTAKVYYQDGYRMGVLNDYTVGQDGVITGVYTNDQTQPIYRVALAQFANPMGLEKVGDTMFRASINSGMALIDAASENGSGTIAGGTLEMSNVDLTEEFTRLIIAQRGFQANTRVVTTSDQILEEVVNLKR